MIGVELAEEGQGVGAKLGQRKLAVVVGVGGGEPGSDRIGLVRPGPVGLARRTDEDIGRPASVMVAAPARTEPPGTDVVIGRAAVAAGAAGE